MEFKEKYENSLKKLNELKALIAYSKHRLHIAYQYKEDLIRKMQVANENIDKEQELHYSSMTLMQNAMDEIKDEFDFHIKELEQTV